MRENAIKSDPAFSDGFYASAQAVYVGLCRHAEVWSVIGFCPQFYRQEVWCDIGFSSLDESTRGFWEAYFLPMDPNNLLCMARKWRHGDVSLHTGGDLEAALGRIKAKMFVMPFGNEHVFSTGGL